jgi:hypothetical protein
MSARKIDTAAGLDRTCHIVLSRVPWRCAPLMDTRPDSVLGGFRLLPSELFRWPNTWYSNNRMILNSFIVVTFPDHSSVLCR